MSTKRMRVIVVLVAAVIAAVTGVLPRPAVACDYCTEVCCGCDSPPLGYYLSCSCACAGGNCTRSCRYIMLPS
ncbi:MAG: hypothetical protein ACOY3Y_21210 [Acidobacteriota bacterium]